jgi:cytochrome d ubiquinol oxidase subunit I
VWVRFPHMLIAAYLTGAFCVAATGAWYRLKGIYATEGMTMLRMGLFLAAVLVPAQLFFGHLNGDYVHEKQPAKFAAIEGRWQDEQPAGEVVIAIPDEAAAQNHFELKIPYLGSLIASMRLDSKEVGLTSFPMQDRPPVAIPFFAFRAMVGCGLVMMALAWLGSLHLLIDRARGERLLLWLTFLSFPLPFVATLTGWFTAEVGRQPWSVYGLLRTAEAVTPTLDVQAVTISLAAFALVYLLIFSFGTLYVYRLLRAGPGETTSLPAVNPKRPLAITGTPAAGTAPEGNWT